MNSLFLWIHINTNDPAGGIVIKESLWTECQPSESYESYFQKVKCLLARGTEIAVYELDKELKKKKKKTSFTFCLPNYSLGKVSFAA